MLDGQGAPILDGNGNPTYQQPRLISFTQPHLGGKLRLQNGQLLYTPRPEFEGRESFHYWISDFAGTECQGGLAVSQVDIDVEKKPTKLPLAEITQPGSPSYAAGGIAANFAVVREGVLTVTGTATDRDAGEPFSYELYLMNMSGDEVDHASGGRIENGTLATFDLTKQRNGAYDLLLIVSGGYGQIVETSARFILDSELKIGQFTFSEQDAVVPAKGMPLTVVRTYDSLNAAKGDFGSSWTFAINTMDVELDEFRRSMFDSDSNSYFSMRDGGGRNVTLTLPDGRRTTFIFTLVKCEGDEFGLCYTPKFISAPGVDAKLETKLPESLHMMLTGNLPPFWAAGDPRLPEESYEFSGYVLTTTDGTKYHLDREEDSEETHTVTKDSDDESAFWTYEVTAYGNPKLTRIEQPDGSIVHIGDSRVWEQDKNGNEIRSLHFERASDGRITGVYDPSSLEYATVESKQVLQLKSGALPLVKYNYDAQERLTSVCKLVDPSNANVNLRYQTNSFYSYHPTFENYITQVRDSRGIPLVRNEYYADVAGVDKRDVGSLKSVQASDGTITTFEREYVTNNFREITDPARDGAGTNDQAVIVQQTITVYPVYAGGTVSGDTGITTVHQTDARGNVIYSFDHLGNKTSQTYDQFNNVTEQRRFVVGSTATDRSLDVVTLSDRLYKTEHQKPTSEILQEISTRGRNESGELLRTRTTYSNGLPRASFDAKNFASSRFYTTNIYNETTRNLIEVRAMDGTVPTVISKQIYHASNATDFPGYLNYSEDAVGTRTYNIYHDNTDPAHGRYGDLKEVVVKDNTATPQTLSRATYQYDHNGNRTNEVQYRGATDLIITTNVYDLQNRLVAAHDAEGGVSRTFYNSSGKVEYTKDKYGNETHYVYGPGGELNKTIYPDLSISRTATQHTYESGTPARRLKQVITEEPHYPSGHAKYDANKPVISSRATYDEIGRAIRNERLRGAGISEVTVVQGDFPGMTTALIVPVTKTTFNAAAITVLSRTTTIYKPAGQVDHTEETYFDGTTPVVLPQTTSYTYDGNGRRKEVVTVTGSGPSLKTVRSVSKYDANGNQEEVYTIATAVDPIEAALAEIKSTAGVKYQYDDFNRVTNTIHQKLSGQNESGRYQTSTRYDIMGRRIEEIDKAGVGTAFEYDKMGRLISVTNAYRAFAVDGTTPITPADQTVTRYEYDWVGNMTAQIDANETVKKDAGQSYVATRFEYDKSGRRTRRTLPVAPPSGNQFETTVYDPIVNSVRLHRTIHTDFKGITVTNLHDNMGRLAKRQPAADSILPTGGNVAVSFTYGASGKRETMTDALGVTEYDYDDFGRLKTKEVPFNTFTYNYHPRGSLKEIKSARAGAVANTYTYEANYEWDELNRLKEVYRAATPSEKTSYTYNDFGSLETVTYPVQDGSGNFVNTRYLYDHQHRLTDMYVKRGLEGNAVSLAEYAYNTAILLGKNGNRRSAIETINGNTRTVHYEYDHLYRLTKEVLVSGSPSTGSFTYDGTAGYGDSTGYDRVGNRRLRNVRDASLNPATIGGLSNQALTYDQNDRLTGTGNESDANGNTLVGAVPAGASPPSATYKDEYDYNNRLIKRADGTNTIAIVYDGDGNRVMKAVTVSGTGTTNYFVVDTLNPSGYAQVLEEWTTTSGNVWNQTRSYLHGHDLISQTQVGTSDVIHFYGYDGHGNVRFLIEADGDISDTYTYDAFGTLIQNAGSTPNRYLYCGEQWDSDLGFYYLRARSMNPNSGRFWTMDSYEGSSQDPLTLHKYLYAHASPPNTIDPSGHFAERLSVSGIMGMMASVALPAVINAGAAGAATINSVGMFLGASTALYLSSGYFLQVTVRDWIDKAKNILRRKLNRDVDLPKVVPIPAMLMPHIAANISMHQAANPDHFLLRACLKNRIL